MTRPCPHCHAAIRTPIVGATRRGPLVSQGGWRLHVRACVRKRPDERAYFLDHGRWPTAAALAKGVV